METENVLYDEIHNGVYITVQDITGEIIQESSISRRTLLLAASREHMCFKYKFFVSGSKEIDVRFIQETRQIQLIIPHDCGSATIEIIPLPAFMFDSTIPPQPQTETSSEGDVKADAI